MTNKKKGNAFTNNPIVRAIGVQKIVVVLVLILLLVFFSVKSSSFWTYASLLSIMDYTYYLAFLGIGVTFCLITGGVDLSIGTGMFCYALAGGYLITKLDMPVIVGILVTMGMGILVGLVNGLIVSKGGHAPFLATQSLPAAPVSHGRSRVLRKAGREICSNSRCRPERKFRWAFSGY